MVEIDAEALAENALLIGLISRSQLREARDEAEDGTGEALARTLMRKGFLTSWQRDKLLKGDTSGFFYGDTKALFHLAEGTFARVYRGVRADGESVAIKVLRRRFCTETIAVERFNKEAEAGMKLVHPNIAKIHGHGEQDRNYFMTMEFVEGSNLREFLKIRKSLSTKDALPLIVGLAKGLQYSQEMGVTHRDIKATNVLIGSRGDAKLVDFGLAEIDTGDFSAAASTGVRTVDYSALERGCGSPKGDPRSDIYFLGCVYYQMLTGTPPMAETETSDQLAKMLKRSFSAIKPITEHRLAPPPKLGHIIEKMMKTELRSRYQNMEDVVKDLVAFQASYPGQAASPEVGSGGSNVAIPKKAEKTRHPTGSINDLFEAAFGYLPEDSEFSELSEPEGPKTLICVEVQDSIQEAFRKVFEKMGYDAKLVSDPELAVDLYRDAPSHGVVFDVDGLEPDCLDYLIAARAHAQEVGKPFKALVLLGPRQARLAGLIPKDDHISILNKPLKMKDVQEALLKLVPPGISG